MQQFFERIELDVLWAIIHLWHERLKAKRLARAMAALQALANEKKHNAP